MPARESVKTKGSEALRAFVAPQVPQDELASKLGVTQQTISNYANGLRRPPPEAMAKLEDLLGIPMRAWAEKPDGGEVAEESEESEESSQPAAE